MALLTTIAGVPLYTTIQEAIAWARGNRLSGYHTHGWQGQTGYMGGSNHSIAVQSLTPTLTPTPIPQSAPTSTPTATTPTPLIIPPGGGSGGGGGGY